MELNTTNSLPGIPRVRVLDENGKVVLQGYYIHHVNRQLCVIGDSLKEEDVDHLVAHDGFADWNMPQELKVSRVTPPHAIEIIEEADA